MAFKQEVNTPLILTIGIVSGLMLVVIMVGLEAWFKSEEQAELASKWEMATNATLTDLRAQQDANTTRYGWVDKDKKAAVIPVSQAMQIIAQGQGKVPCTQSTK